MHEFNQEHLIIHHPTFRVLESFHMSPPPVFLVSLRSQAARKRHYACSERRLFSSLPPNILSWALATYLPPRLFPPLSAHYTYSHPIHNQQKSIYLWIDHRTSTAASTVISDEPSTPWRGDACAVVYTFFAGIFRVDHVLVSLAIVY